MKALTLTQPWATLVVLGIKRWETRGWFRRDVGRFAIHAGKGWSAEDRAFADDLHERGVLPVPRRELPLGAVIGEVNLGGLVQTGTAVRKGYISDLEQSLGNYEPGRYAWELFDPVAYPEPIPARGSLGFWDWIR